MQSLSRFVLFLATATPPPARLLTAVSRDGEREDALAPIDVLRQFHALR